MSQATAPYLSPQLRRVTGPALRPGGLELTQRGMELASLTAGSRVLDLGCGTGFSASHLAYERGYKVIGLDISVQMLAEARVASPDLCLLAGRAGALPLVSGCMAGVLAECVLSLAGDVAAWLGECRRVLEPGGKLVVSDIYLRQPPEDGNGLDLPGCLGGARGREGWLALLAEAGFTVLAWEDHSPLLRELSARLVWEHGSTAAFWRAWCGGKDCTQAMERAALAKPGYFLVVAQKGEGEHHG